MPKSGTLPIAKMDGTAPDLIARMRMRADHAENDSRFGDAQDFRDGAFQLERANRLVGWMMQYIGRMCPPNGGLADLNEHCCDNKVPQPGDEIKGRPLNQHYNHITE